MLTRLCRTALVATIAIGALVMTIPEAQAAWELDMPTGVTTLSAEIFDLHRLILLVCTVICIAVFGFAFYTMWSCRRSTGAKAAKFSHSTRAEIIWTLIPTLILVAMAIPSARTIIKL